MPPKFFVPLSQRFRGAIQRHKPLIAVVAAIAVIATTATLISVRLDASPRPSGEPPMVIPSLSKSPLPALASSAWPTTPPDSAPATCKQISLQGAAGASVVHHLRDEPADITL